MSEAPERGRRELVGVGYAANALEAQMIKGLLESEGIDAIVSSDRTGSRAVMVGAARAEEARALIAATASRAEGEAESLPEPDGEEESDPLAVGPPRDAGARARAYVLAVAALGLAFGIFLLLHAL